MKKAIIFSTANDVSTDLVMDWVWSKGVEPQRICNERLWGNSQSVLQIASAKHAMTEIQIDGKSLSRQDIASVYIRKGGSRSSFNRNKNIPAKLYEDVSHEVAETIDFLKIAFNDKVVLGRMENDHHKLYQLEIAKMAGLETPETLVTNHKKTLTAFLQKHGKVITKSIDIIQPTAAPQSVTVYYTALVSKKAWANCAATFAPGLFQEYIEKEFEIRSFYLNGKCYSMAIFSQGNAQTNVDYRNYDQVLPNRTVPMNLPKEIVQKIRFLMKKLGLNTGSIDLIKSTDGRYVFLEVNQAGQFGMVSKPCNYYLEEKIAACLTNA